MKFWKYIFGDESDKKLKEYSNLVKEINYLESDYEKKTDEELLNKTKELKEKVKKLDNFSEVLPEAFANVRESAKRTLNQRHYDVQLLGGIVMHNRAIAEMKTGEGKTLVATLAAYLFGLKDKGVHIITVNDYLARRDAVWMGQIYDKLGLTVGVINDRESYVYDPEHKELDEKRDTVGGYKVVYEFLRPASRKEAYDADITYGTNNQFAFDYLRDNTAYKKEQLVQRGFHYAIVDEIDSILIDEARQPLIISSPAEENESFYGTFTQLAKDLEEGTDYTKDEKTKTVSITEVGIKKAETKLKIDNLYSADGSKYIHYLNNALSAKSLFKKDKEYVVRNNQIIIVDEFTGRLQPGRRWSNKLHQAIESKESVTIEKESRTVASITYQNYFRHYTLLSGMTGTAKTSEEEFRKVYDLDVISIPTNKPLLRKDEGDNVYLDEETKIKAIISTVKELNKKGQPVLIGTTSIDKNEELSEHLSKAGVKHNLLNAKNHEREGEIIAQAGAKHAVTIATNLAGRGVDIKLGGLPFEGTKAEEVKELGGLYILGTERHEARRIDDQLRGRAGRQGDSGVTKFYVSLEDTLMRVFGGERIKNIMDTLNFPKDEPLNHKMVTSSIENAQKKIEGHYFDSRRFVLQYDKVVDVQRQNVYEERRKVLLGNPEYVESFVNKYNFEQNFKDIYNKRKEEFGDQFDEVIQQIVLKAIDLSWIRHIESMEYTRSSVGLRSYGQRDPIIEYKNEGARLFAQFWDDVGIVMSNLVNNAKPEDK